MNLYVFILRVKLLVFLIGYSVELEVGFDLGWVWFLVIRGLMWFRVFLFYVYERLIEGLIFIRGLGLVIISG